MSELSFEPSFRRRTNEWKSQPVQPMGGAIASYTIIGTFTPEGDPRFVCYWGHGTGSTSICISKGVDLLRLWEAEDHCEEHYKRERARIRKQFGAGNLGNELLDH